MFEEQMNGLKPYDWQLDVAEALILSLDCITIARMGAGKSMPFVIRFFYAALGTLRAFVPAKVPILATSAMLPPIILAHVQKSLHMDFETTFYINQGTDQPKFHGLCVKVTFVVLVLH